MKQVGFEISARGRMICGVAAVIPLAIDHTRFCLVRAGFQSASESPATYVIEKALRGISRP